MADNVRFSKGVSANFRIISKDPHTLYFLTDTKEMYLGGDKYAFGKDVSIDLVGSGDVVSDALWEPSTKTLTLYRGRASDCMSIQTTLRDALAQYVKSVSSLPTSAISVDNSDPQNPQIGLKFSEDTQGNVRFHENAEGLWASVDVDDLTEISVDPEDKILFMEDSVLSAHLSLTTEKDSENGKTYVILKGKDGAEISKFDASDFLKNGLLKSAAIRDTEVDGEIHKYLVLTFDTQLGSESTVECDLQEFLNAYVAAEDGGLVLDGNKFSIRNAITPSDGLNSNINLLFGSGVTLNTIKYDSHGLITGTGTYSVNLASLSGQVGEAGSKSNLVTFVKLDNTGTLSGETVSIVNSVDGELTDDQVLTAKAVKDAIGESAVTTWNVF